ncbi:MAG: conjugative transposon protein TraN [Agriterribacter sp.]
MKYLFSITTAVMLLFAIQARAQDMFTPYAVKSSKGHPLSISEAKTTSIVFPFDIISVDRGRKEVMVQKAKGVNNILLLKAGKTSFPETNLTVITADGQLYPFVLNYDRNPDSLYLSFKKTGNDELTKSGKQSPNIATVEKDFISIKEKVKPARAWLKKVRYGITLGLQDLYVNDNVMYFQFKVRNCSHVDYTTSSFNIFIKDKKQRKRTATQEVACEILATDGDYQLIKGKTVQTFILAVPKFTIPDKKKCIIQLMEKNGGRNISLKINNSRIIKAKLIVSNDRTEL